MVSRSENDDISKVSPEATASDGAEDLMHQGQANIWRHMLAFADSMALKSAVELRIADIIHSHGRPITLSQIALCIDSPSPDIAYLSRIMRFLVHIKIFTAERPPPPPQRNLGETEMETLYGLTPSSKWLLHDEELTLAPMILMENHPSLTAPWHCFAACVKEGGNAFEKAHDRQVWDLASENPEFNKLFNDAMACTAKISIKAVMAAYKDGFGRIGTLVDVGGGTGGAVAEVVKAYPHINGINFDLPHVVATAPPYEGVSHVGGDMFHSIPDADAIFMKWILHDWNDEYCVKILKNCRKAIPEKTGKIIIIDAVIRPDGDDPFDKTRLVFDLTMIAATSHGKERTEVEWKKLLEEGGFPRYNIIEIPNVSMIIEAYPA